MPGRYIVTQDVAAVLLSILDIRETSSTVGDSFSVCRAFEPRPICGAANVENVTAQEVLVDDQSEFCRQLQEWRENAFLYVRVFHDNFISLAGHSVS